MRDSSILDILPLGFPWQTLDPFLFCVFHEDFYPQGNAQLGPAASLKGRSLGQDFTLKDGWRMYHGESVPGFPGHPHRGFETITVVNRGTVDHADSAGAAGRYGGGDVQWMTAGRGLQHSEMFPLLNSQEDNPLELFQIWLNLPRAKKLVEPHFKMLWNEQIPRVQLQDETGKQIRLDVIAGDFEGHSPPAPPPDSWAADPEHQVLIWTLCLEAGAQWTLPAAERKDLNRMLYFFKGESLQLNGTHLPLMHGAKLDPGQEIQVKNGEAETRLLLLQGQAINEPVAQHGPFVMNYKAEILQAIDDFQKTEFGGWPWERRDPVHGPASQGRFARHADGREETPQT